MPPWNESIEAILMILPRMPCPGFTGCVTMTLAAAWEHLERDDDAPGPPVGLPIEEDPLGRNRALPAKGGQFESARYGGRIGIGRQDGGIALGKGDQMGPDDVGVGSFGHGHPFIWGLVCGCKVDLEVRGRQAGGRSG